MQRESYWGGFDARELLPSLEYEWVPSLSHNKIFFDKTSLAAKCDLIFYWGDNAYFFDRKSHTHSRWSGASKIFLQP